MIISMKRITLVAHKADEEAILEALQATSAVEIIDTAQEEQTSGDAALAAAENNVGKLDSALKAGRAYAPKKGLLAPMPEESLAAITGQMPEAIRFSEQVDAIVRELAKVKGDIEKDGALIDSLRAWENFPDDMLHYQSAKRVHYFVGMLSSVDAKRLEELDDCVEYQFYGEGNMRPCVVYLFFFELFWV